VDSGEGHSQAVVGVIREYERALEVVIRGAPCGVSDAVKLDKNKRFQEGVHSICITD